MQNMKHWTFIQCQCSQHGNLGFSPLLGCDKKATDGSVLELLEIYSLRTHTRSHTIHLSTDFKSLQSDSKIQLKKKTFSKALEKINL